jgi:hypothetical protein
MDHDTGWKLRLYRCWLHEFNGVDQSVPVGTVEETTDYDGSPISVTVPADGLAADLAAHGQPNDAVCAAQSAGGSQTIRFDDCADDGFFATSAYGSTRTITGSFTWTNRVGAYNVDVGVPIQCGGGRCS